MIRTERSLEAIFLRDIQDLYENYGCPLWDSVEVPGVVGGMGFLEFGAWATQFF